MRLGLRGNNSANLEIAPFAGAFGAELSGLRLDLGFDEPTARTVVRLLSQYQFLLLRGQSLNPTQQVLACKRFGSVETHRFHTGQLVGHPAIFRISNCHGDGHTAVGHYWHCDGFAFSSPTEIIMLNIMEPASIAGETVFADGYAAWDSLPDGFRDQLRNVRWKHQSGVWHQFHRQHFLTERNSLMVNLGRITDIERLDTVATSSLIAGLCTHISTLSRVYTHRWQKGDVMLIDNWSIVHKANPAPQSSRRVMHRTSVLKLHSFS